MHHSNLHPLEDILRLCAAALPDPWYPSVYVKQTGVPRDRLDPYLDQLRLGGLIALTPWEPQRGQGYALTPQGADMLASPRQLARLCQESGAAIPQIARTIPEVRSGQPGAWERGEAIREAFLSPAPPVVTIVLMVVNIILFVIDLPQILRAFGIAERNFFADTLYVSGAHLVEGQWWRLLTCCFVHGGLAHIVVNMFGLYMLGQTGERIWGRWRFLTIYLLAGLGGSCLAMMLQPWPGVLGASGALCGILAAEGAWLLLNRQYLPPNLSRIWSRNLIVNFLLMAGISASALIGFPISWQGHLGGAIVGAIVAALLNYQRFGSRALGWASVVATALTPVFCVVLLLQVMHSARWKAAVAPALEHKREIAERKREAEEQDRKRKQEEEEAKRKRKQEEEEQKRYQADFNDFNQRIIASVTAADRAFQPDRALEALLKQSPATRDPEIVKASLGQVRAARDLVSGAKELLEKAAYRSHVEDARKAALQLMLAQDKLLQASETCLRSTVRKADENYETWKKQRDATDEARNHWRNFLAQ